MAKHPVKQYQFIWQAKDTHQRIIKGEILAPSLPLAKIQLRKQGINPIKIKRHTESFWRRRKLGRKDISLFTRQLATILKAGVPLIQGFDIMMNGASQLYMRQLIAELKLAVEQGHSLNEALRQHPQYFDNLYCSLVQTGELSGTLDIMLERLALHLERIDSLIKKVKKALFYPTAIVIVTLVVIAVMLLFVIPQFETMYASFGAKLPTYTMMVMSLSKVVQDFWWIILAIIVIGVSGWRYLRRHSPAFNAVVDKWLLKLPILGPILSKSVVARFARTLSTTFAAGTPLVDALGAVAGAAGNIVYQKAVLQIQKEVEVGVALHVAMSNTKVFPAMLVQMVAIGEESGSLDNMLDKAAVSYEEDVSTAVDGLSSLLEPIIMVVIGSIVGALVIAMYLPIFKLGSVL